MIIKRDALIKAGIKLKQDHTLSVRALKMLFPQQVIKRGRLSKKRAASRTIIHSSIEDDTSSDEDVEEENIEALDDGVEEMEDIEVIEDSGETSVVTRGRASKSRESKTKPMISDDEDEHAPLVKLREMGDLGSDFSELSNDSDNDYGNCTSTRPISSSSSSTKSRISFRRVPYPYNLLC